MPIPPESMAGRDSEKRWQLGIPGCSVVIRPAAPRSSSNEAGKAGRNFFLRFKIPRFAISIKIGKGKKKVPQTGLEWLEDIVEEALRELEPHWTVEPDLEAVRRAVEAVFPSQKIDVTFLAQGTENKVYNIRSEERECVMRVSLLVDPKWKILSEVATLRWIRREQLLPVPEVFEFAYETGRHNPVGFEWILMSKVPGRPLPEAWRSMSLEAKKKLVGELAVYSSRMFRKQLRGIGDIYPVVAKPKASNFLVSKSKARKERFPKVKRIAKQFFWSTTNGREILVAPFRSSKDWLDVRLLLCEHECHSILARELAKREGKDPDEDDQKNLESVRKAVTDSLAVVRRLKDLLNSSVSPFSKPDTNGTPEHPRSRHCFPFIEQNASEPSMLVHDDLNMHNILVDEAGDLTGVIDWECITALPLWKACDYPWFLLQRLQRQSKEYEMILLRRHFLDEMRTLEPGWVKLFEASERQRDFDLAVTQCDICNNYTTMRINEWIDDIMSGVENLRSLRDRLYTDP